MAVTAARASPEALRNGRLPERAYVDRFTTTHLREISMNATKDGRLLAAIVFGIAVPLLAQADPVEPNAGTWRTWVIPSGSQYRAPPPPTAEETVAELDALNASLAHTDTGIRSVIRYWDAGAPSYRWIEFINDRVNANLPATAYSHRVHTYLAMAMYDATIATWDSKYFYNRKRPSESDNRLHPVLDVPQSPSYPSEHAATAQAAATVLAYFFPSEADAWQAMAEQAGWSRVLAGVNYPSDHLAGLALGRRVAEQVLAKAKADGTDVPWTGTVPTGPCKWVGTNPGNAAAATWKPLLLASPDQFRPPPPPDCASAQVQAEVAAVKNFPRTFITNYKAYYYQSPEGRATWAMNDIGKWHFEDGLDRNPPRTARAYALVAATLYDAFIASQDGKFAYWYLRPNMLDPTIVPLFPVPPFPSYPSNHSTFSTAQAEVLAYLFPTRADAIRAVGKEAGDSRIWAGIHYQMDNVAGVALGKSVADVFIQRATGDGAAPVARAVR
jgi:membrane-associated phospholipid phosphatase